METTTNPNRTHPMPSPTRRTLSSEPGGTQGTLVAREDLEILARFAAVGLAVEIVDGCGDVSCPSCSAETGARAA